MGVKVFSRWSNDLELELVIGFEEVLRLKSNETLIVADSDVIKTAATLLSNKSIERNGIRATVRFDNTLTVLEVVDEPTTNEYDLNGDNVYIGDTGVFINIALLVNGSFNEAIFNAYFVGKQIVVSDLTVGPIDVSKIDEFLNQDLCDDNLEDCSDC